MSGNRATFNIQDHNEGQDSGEPESVLDIMKHCMPFIDRYWRPVIEEFQFPWLDESWKTFFLWILSIIVDPLICYVPVINDEKKSLDFEIAFLVIIFVFYGAIYVIQLCIYVHKFKKLEAGSYSKLWKAFVLVAPLVPIIANVLLQLLLYFKATKMIRASIFSVGMAIFLILHLVRVLGISKLFIAASLMKTAALRIGINFLLYFYGGHLFGGLWYFFAVWDKMECWNSACESHHDECHYANHRFIVSSANNSFLNDICFDKTTYEVGIFKDALQSGIVETRNLPKKLLYCFRWGMQNLSGYGGSLLVSTHTWENFFVILIVVYGIVTFTFFVGNMQNLITFSISKLEETRWTRQDLEKWSPFGKLSRADQNLIVKKCRQSNWPQTGVINIKNLLNNLPADVEKDIKRILCLNMLREVEEFQNWSNELLNELCDRAKPVLYEKDTQIVQKDSPIDEMLFVVEGKLRIYSSTAGNKSISHLDDGGFCGEELIAWFQNSPQSSELPTSTKTIRVVKQVDAFALVSDDLQHVIERGVWPAARASTEEQGYPAEP